MEAEQDGGRTRWWHFKMGADGDGGKTRWWQNKMVVEQDGGGTGWWQNVRVAEHDGGRTRWWKNKMVVTWKPPTGTHLNQLGHGWHSGSDAVIPAHISCEHHKTHKNPPNKTKRNPSKTYIPEYLREGGGANKVWEAHNDLSKWKDTLVNGREGLPKSCNTPIHHMHPWWNRMVG